MILSDSFGYGQVLNSQNFGSSPTEASTYNTPTPTYSAHQHYLQQGNHSFGNQIPVQSHNQAPQSHGYNYGQQYGRPPSQSPAPTHHATEAGTKDFLDLAGSVADKSDPYSQWKKSYKRGQ